MGENLALFNNMAVAARHLASVKRPLPDHFSEHKVEHELNEFEGFFDSDVLFTVDASLDEITMLTSLIVSVQVWIFNRPMRSVTAASLADSVLTVIPSAHLDSQSITKIAMITLQLSRYLIDQKVIASGVDEDYLGLLKQRNPSLAAALTMDDDQADAYWDTVDRDFFKNSPVVLLDEDITMIYAQDSTYGVNFNDFIAEIARCHSPAQLQLAYTLFLGTRPFYKFILDYGDLLAAPTPTIDFGELNNVFKAPMIDLKQLQFSFQMQLTFSRGLTSDGVILLSKTIHQFLKFCLDRQLITARIYAITLKLSNRGLIRAAVVRNIDVDQTQLRLAKEVAGETLADQIFTKPNYTINVKTARNELAKLDMAPVAEPINLDATLVLKRALSPRQQANEVARAEALVNELETIIGDQISAATKARFHKMLIQVHQNMVQKYHRRLQQWTRDSIQAALQDLFQTNRELDHYPTFLRYWSTYLTMLYEDNKINSFHALSGGFLRSSFDYICCSTNALVTDR